MGVKVKQRKGAWWVYINHKGRRKAKRVGDKKAAELAATKIRARLAEGNLSALEDQPSVPTLSQYADEWLGSEAALRLKPISLERYRSTLQRHILPAFGGTRLSELSRSVLKVQIGTWLTSGRVRGKGPLHPETVRLLIAVLRSILNTAMEDGLIGANPAVRLGRLVRGIDVHVDEAPDPFTAEELPRVLGTAESDYPEWYPFFLTMARTGLRVGECLALQRDDADLRRGTLWVRRTWTRGRLGTTKGGRSRAVDLSPQVIKTLGTWLSMKEADAAVEGRPASPWVFPSPSGGPWDDRWVRWHIWRPLLRRAGLRHRGMHQFRHTYASLLIAAGAHPKYIQAQLGHASIQVTMDVYGHLFPGTFGRLVDALDDAAIRNPGATDAWAESEMSN